MWQLANVTQMPQPCQWVALDIKVIKCPMLAPPGKLLLEQSQCGLLGRGYQSAVVTESRWWHFATSWELETPALWERR